MIDERPWIRDDGKREWMSTVSQVLGIDPQVIWAAAMLLCSADDLMADASAEVEMLSSLSGVEMEGLEDRVDGRSADAIRAAVELFKERITLASEHTIRTNQENIR